MSTRNLRLVSLLSAVAYTACSGGGSSDSHDNETAAKGSASAYAVAQGNGSTDAGGADSDAPMAEVTSDAAATAALAVGWTAPKTTTAAATPGSAQEQAMAVTPQALTAATPQVKSLMATFDAIGDTISTWKYGDNAVPVPFKGTVVPAIGFNSSQAGALNFDLSCKVASISYTAGTACGNSAMLWTKLTTVLPATSSSSVAFDIRGPGASSIVELAVWDTTSQRINYRFDPRTVESQSTSQWTHMTIPLSLPFGFSGGANDGVVHGGITQIAFTAGSVGLQMPPDQLLVDNVTLVSNSDFNYQLLSNAPLVGGSYYPSYEGRLAVNLRANDGSTFDKAKSVGITVARKDLKWSEVERNGVMNFVNFDGWTTALAARGMSMLWILDYGHPDHGGVAPLTSIDQQAYATFAAAAADHYRGKNVVGFEIWNEPNYSQYWPGGDPVSYGNLVAVTAPAIKAKDATTKVISGGVAIDGIKALPFLTRLAQSGKLSSVDAVAVHPYRAVKPETFAADAAPLKNLLATYGLPVTPWTTESGYSSYGYFNVALFGDGHDPRALRYHGILTLRNVLTQLSMNLPLMTIYALVDEGVSATDREQNFGLLAQDLSDKPAMTALRTLYAAAHTRTFKGPLSDLPPIGHAMRWDGTADSVFVVWNDTATTSLTVALPANTTAVQRWDGTTVTPTNSSIKLLESDGPIFVTTAN